MSYIKIIELTVPETILAITIFIILSVDLFFYQMAEIRKRLLVSSVLSIAGCVAAIVSIGLPVYNGELNSGVLVSSSLTNWIKIALILCSIFTVLISYESLWIINVSEYYSMILLALVGMLFLVSSENLLMIFISLELIGISLYVLTAFYKGNKYSLEAGFKYFIFGGVTSAFFLFGLSLIYGITGSIELSKIVKVLPVRGEMTLLMLSLAMIIGGFGFKIAAAPFHLWTPDVYQCAPIPSAAFIASGSKLAAFYFFTKLMVVGFDNISGRGEWGRFIAGWIPMLCSLAVASILIGNLAALVQREFRRLIAYSAVAHAGYILLGTIACGNSSSRINAMSAVVFYTVTYALTTIGIFAVVSAIEKNYHHSSFKEFSGLYKKSPLLSIAMAIFLLSLAGIPPLAGFFGKFYLFSAAASMEPARLGMVWIVVIAVVMSAVSLYYYLLVLKQIFVVEPENNSPFTELPLIRLVVIILAIVILLLGIYPDLLLNTLGLNLIVKGSI
ncbi:MAG: NADH-quinone oxidoreductase subunit N [Verrucomicrobiia bacterium]